jgi:antitoxin component YwqK of YwqJK toxin-antitoxin module
MKMQFLLLLIFPSFLFSQSNQPVDTLEVNQQETRNRLTYKIGSDKPFTGILIIRYRNGGKMNEESYVNGKPITRINWAMLDGITIKEKDTLINNYWKTLSQTNYNNKGKKIWYQDRNTGNETSWYNDGSKKEEIINGKRSKVWDHYGNEIIPGQTILQDTIGSSEIEVKNNVSYKKGNDKPYTGMMSFLGELMLYDTHYSFKNRLFRGEVSIISGDFDGPYYSWYENGKKRFEATIKNRKLDGAYTSWYLNGNKNVERSYTYGRKDGGETVWHENGQMLSKGEFNSDGYPVGLHTTWNENGVKLLEATYFDKKEIKINAWDENGNKVKEWPEIDEDKFGMRVFLEKLISILKSKNYDAIEDLYMSKETLAYFFTDPRKEELDNDGKQIIDQWPEYISHIKEEFKKVADNELYEIYLKNAKINSVIFDYYIEQNNLDDSSIEVKWPESINYDLSTSRIVLANTKIILDTDEEPIVIVITLVFINNKWCVFLMERDLIGINIQY